MAQRLIDTGVLDPRPTIPARMRRTEIKRVLRAYGIPFDEELPKQSNIQGQPDLLKLLEGNGIDPTKPLPDGTNIGFETVRVEVEKGKYEEQVVPAVQEHASKGHEGLAEAALARKAEAQVKAKQEADARAAAKAEAVKDERIAELERRLAALDKQRDEPDFHKLKWHDLRAYAKGRGVQVRVGMKKAEVIQALEALDHGEDSA